MSQMKTIKAVLQEKYDNSPFDFGNEYEHGSLDRVIASLVAIRESLPVEYRDSACCELSADAYYDSPTMRIEVSYQRPETPGEEQQRKLDERERAKRDDTQARAEYEKLKARFEK